MADAIIEANGDFFLLIAFHASRVSKIYQKYLEKTYSASSWQMQLF